MKTKIYLFTFLAVILSMTSCNEFIVSNDNPDIALNINNNPELLLTNIQRNAVRRAVNSSWSEGNLMAQYGARIVFTSFDLFDWGDQAGAWNTFFLAIRDAKELEKIALEKQNPSYEAVSKILQTWMFQILTDMWGDIPYYEASKAVEGIYNPAYDMQEDIYLGMLDELKIANDLLSGTNLPAIKGDIILNGDLDKWRKFANSLRLRIALRMSKANPNIAETHIAEIFNNPSQFPVMESNSDNATITFLPSNPDAHPVTEESVYRVGSYNEYRIAETLVGLLRTYNDPRLAFWADPTASSVEEGNPRIEGMQNGIVDGPAYEYKGGDSFLSKFNIEYFFFQANTNEGRMMTHAEVEFVFAEAAQNGWITSNAKSHYENGITSAINYWGIAVPENYLAQESVAFDGSLEQIINQKYLALFYTDFQGFIEFRRTGFPKTIKPGPDAFYSNYPSRFEYPSKEQALNATSYNTAVSRQGPDEITTKVWWEK